MKSCRTRKNGRNTTPEVTTPSPEEVGLGVEASTLILMISSKASTSRDLVEVISTTILEEVTPNTINARRERKVGVGAVDSFLLKTFLVM